MIAKANYKELTKHPIRHILTYYPPLNGIEKYLILEIDMVNGYLSYLVFNGTHRITCNTLQNAIIEYNK
jgi:hypothetical protein